MLNFILLLADRVFGPDTNTPEVYEVAALPVVKAAMEGVNGMLTFLFVMEEYDYILGL